MPHATSFVARDERKRLVPSSIRAREGSLILLEVIDTNPQTHHVGFFGIALPWDREGVEAGSR